jgi:hypothetical protein
MEYAFQLFSARKFGELDPIPGRLRRLPAATPAGPTGSRLAARSSIT